MAPTKKFACEGGFIKTNVGQRFVRARDLPRLYGIDPKECVFLDRPYFGRTYDRDELASRGIVFLKPLPYGTYPKDIKAMDIQHIKPTLKIRTNPELHLTTGMMIREDYLRNRKPNAVGTIHGYVGGHGGDVWWVIHEDESIAPYMFSEFEPTEPVEAPQEAVEAPLPPEVYRAADEARTAFLRDVDANDQMSALAAGVDAAVAKLRTLEG